MKSLKDLLLSPEPAEEIVMGNTALVRAMFESGVRVATSYPGSPTPEIASAISTVPVQDCPLYFEFSTNEKVATEVAFGASVNGRLSCVFFKSVGLNVAADSFVQLGHLELIGGMVIVIGDDPGANSSQNEQDNRHLARLSYIPVLEPASPSEAYAMFKEAAAVSRKMKMPVILRMTTHVCHAKEKVSFCAWDRAPHDDTPLFDVANGPYIPITSLVFPLKRKALAKLAETGSYASSTPSNRLDGSMEGDRGIITAGLPYLSLLDALDGGAVRPDILKLAFVHPLPSELAARFLAGHREVLILEELDDFLEQGLKALAYDRSIPVKITGKSGPEDWIGEYTPDKVREILRKTWPDTVPGPLPPRPVFQSPDSAVPRTPQMCPGCGHRSAFHAVKAALSPSDITVADIGCHSLGFLDPYNMGQVLLCMGHSCGTAAGLRLFNTTRRVVAFLGDSTFFHAGLPGIVNSIFNRHDITLIIMENGTTAMTGHQEHPGTGRNFREATQAIPVRRVLEGLGVGKIYECDTYSQSNLTKLVIQAMEDGEFSVVIARHPCMLKFTRILRRKGKGIPKPVFVGKKCSLSKTCIEEFACPSYQFTRDGRVAVSSELCIGDGSCRQTCPAGAIEASEGKAVAE